REYTYFNNNLVQTEVWKTLLGAVENTINYTYNENNQLKTAGDMNGTITNVYDPLGRLMQRTDVWSKVQNLGYDAADRLTTVNDSFLGVVSNGYDIANRLTTRAFSDNAGHQLSASYIYNNRNQVTSVSRLVGQTAAGSSVYGYDI